MWEIKRTGFGAERVRDGALDVDDFERQQRVPSKVEIDSIVVCADGASHPDPF